MIFKRHPYIPQVDQRDCGVAALAMVLKHFGSTYSLAYLREIAQTSREGTTALGLVQAAKKLGLETQAIKTDMSLFDDPGVTYPFIVHVLKSEGLQHYYTVFGQKKGKIIIGDPDPSKKIVQMDRETFAQEWTGVALFYTPDESYETHQEPLPGLLSFLPILLERKRLIAGIVVLSFLVTVINILGSYYFQTLLDLLIPRADYSLLMIISLGLCVTYLVQQVFTFLKDYLLHRLGNRLSAAVILPYIKHVLSLPMSFFTSRRTGEITSRFSDASTIIDALASTMLSLFLDVTIVITLAVTLLWQSPALFWLSLMVIPLYVVVIFSFYKIFDRQNYQVMEANSQVNTAIIDDLRGIETLKSLRVEDRRYERIEEKFYTYLGRSLRMAKWQLAQDSLKTAIQLVSNVLILYYGAMLVMSGQLSVGQLMTYNMLLTYFTNPLLNIINLQGKLQQARVANNRLQEVYVVDKEKSPSMVTTDFKKISLKQVSHRYGYQTETLKHIDLEIKAGECLAFMGQSGSGKTTLAKILAGYDQPSNGEVTVDDQPVTSADLRQLVTYVPQQAYVFTGTILENLLLGQEGQVEEERILGACQTAAILEDIQKMPAGFQTQISEDGGLSGGQKQRLAIARALLSSQPIMIFDEVTTGLDRKTRNQVMSGLLKLDRTVIFISHEESIRPVVDRIVTMEDGEVYMDRPTFNIFLYR